MTSMSNNKILVLNPSPLNLNKLIKKENALNSSSGPFDFVLLLGDVLDVDNAPHDLLNVTPKTFFTEGVNLTSETENGKEIAGNLEYLGKIGLHTFENGMKMAYITGDLSAITLTQINSVFNGSVVDILISYHWPSAIASELKLTLFGNSKIDTVVKLTKPRYHFSCGSENGKFYERSPIFWKDELRVTRFISLSQYGTKERFHYAFNLSLDSSNDLENITITDDNPFMAKKEFIEPVETRKPEKRTKEEADSIETPLVHKKQKTLVTPNQCFFCLSNPKIETHMIISIAENSYVTVAKGPLTRPHRDLINFSGHGIIIPVSHLPTLLAAKEAEEVGSVTQTKIFKEINQYKEAIVKMFKSIDQDFNVVFFEISRKRSIHYHVQFVPILSKYILKFETSLDKHLKNNEKFPKNYKFDFHKAEKKEDLSKIQEGSEYMLISIWDTPMSKVDYVSELDNAEGQSVDLQFPRRVLANVLNDHKRVYWDKCKQTKQKETEECEKFKSAFKEFDFSVQYFVE